MKEKRIIQVRKRDGRIVSFDKQKITDAIFKAAQSVGGQDRYLAEDLAEVVRMYLEKEYKGDIPSVEEIQDIVERILIKTGHARTAKSYILYRQKRARARQIREGFHPETLAEKESSQRGLSLSVRRSDDKIGIWDKDAIIEALIRETDVSQNIAELIVAEVEEDVVASKIQDLTSSMIRELVNTKLILYGFEEGRLKHSRIGLPFYDISSIFSSFDGTPDKLSAYLGRRMKREFAMNAIISQVLVEKHLKGEIFINSIESLDKILAAYIPADTFEEADVLYNKIAPFVEGCVVFSLPDNAIKTPIANTGFSLDIPLRLLNSIQAGPNNPFNVIRAESKENISQLMATRGAGNLSLAIYPKSPLPLFVLTRVTLNLSVITAYAVQEDRSPVQRLHEILDVLDGLLVAQNTLIHSTPYAKKTLSVFPAYNTTLEIEYTETKNNDWFSVTDLVSAVLSRSLSVFMRNPSDSLQEVAGKRLKQESITVRISNA